MKAVRLLKYGGQLVFEDLPTPAIARDELLVKVKSTTVNHVDLVKASGAVRQILPIELPWIPGHEFSGVVEQIGSDVAQWSPGDAVFGTNGMGAYAEYLAVKATVIARKPSDLSFEEAASVPVAAQTAWEGIFIHGHLEMGQMILIHAGRWRCGRLCGAIGIACRCHRYIATASGNDEAYLKSIGANRVINYHEAQFETGSARESRCAGLRPDRWRYGH